MDVHTLLKLIKNKKAVLVNDCAFRFAPETDNAADSLELKHNSQGFADPDQEILIKDGVPMLYVESGFGSNYLKTYYRCDHIIL